MVAFLVTLGVCFLTFAAINLAPGDVAETVARSSFVFDETPPDDAVSATAERYKLNNPFMLRFFAWLRTILRLNFGVSYSYNRPVMEVIIPKLLNTMLLGGVALLSAVLISIPIGAVAGMRQRSLLDILSSGTSLVLVSIPLFCLGLSLIILFSIKLKILPVSGKEKLESIILPTMTLCLGMIPGIFQITRGSIIDLKNQEFIKMAKAKGLPQSMLVFNHMLKNTAIPLITVIASQAGHILGGSVVVESVFGWPGIGKLIIDSVKSKDIPILQCCVLIIALGYSFINLAADISYAVCDPRIRTRKI
jgi:peptide/nickel transport system permease protein